MTKKRVISEIPVVSMDSSRRRPEDGESDCIATFTMETMP